MPDHFADNIVIYLAALASGCLILWGAMSEGKRDTALTYCYDRGMVLIDTEAGYRCASLVNLYQVR